MHIRRKCKYDSNASVTSCFVEKKDAPHIAVYDTNTALLRCFHMIQTTKENMHRNQISARIQEIYSHIVFPKN